jgi:hypothetical protein
LIKILFFNFTEFNIKFIISFQINNYGNVKFLFLLETNILKFNKMDEIASFSNEDTSVMLNRLEQEFIYIGDLNDPIRIVDDQKAYEAIKYCHWNIFKNHKLKLAELLFKNNIHIKFIDVFDHLYSIRSEIKFDNVIPQCSSYQYYKSTDLNMRRIFNIMSLNTIIGEIFIFSLEFRRLFTKSNNEKNNKTYLEIYINFINDLEFIDNFMKFDPSFDGFINSIQNLSVDADECQKTWNSLNSIEILLKFARSHTKWKVESFATVAFIASDKDIENIGEINEIIKIFVNLTIKCVKNPRYKHKQEFKDALNETKIFTVNSISTGNGFSIFLPVLISCLYKLSVNEKLKMDVFNYPDLKNTLKSLIFDAIEVEKNYGLELFSQLAFNKQVNEELNKDLDLIEYVTKLQNKKDFEFKLLEKTCQNFLWILKSKEKQVENLPLIKTSHIMISYNTASRVKCLKIKDELEKLNFKIWIDVNEIHGSSLDSMAQAVEQSQIVLICITEKYRQSVNCQAEAQYAFKLNKPIVPLIMQAGYNNVSGWLGIIMGDKIFVDFCKYEFNESMSRLKKQIELITKPLNTNLTNLLPLENIQKNNDEEQKNTDSPKNWTEDQVKDWFLSKNLIKIYEEVKPVNGGVLYQLYDMKKNIPEFFYKSITKNETLDYKTIANFGNLLENLFERN